MRPRTRIVLHFFTPNWTYIFWKTLKSHYRISLWTFCLVILSNCGVLWTPNDMEISIEFHEGTNFTKGRISKATGTYIHTSYKYIHTYIHTHHTHIHTYTHTCTHTSYTYIHTYIHTYTRTYIHTHIPRYIRRNNQPPVVHRSCRRCMGRWGVAA